VFNISMLPARQGDCLWVTYGEPKAHHHLVIDGGPEGARTLSAQIENRLKASPDGKLHIDLLVVTHVDNDHIGGVLDVVEHFPAGLTIGEIWFNAYRHLLPADVLGPDQGERLACALDRLKTVPWNKAFGGGAVAVPDSGDLPRITREKTGLVLTLLSPDRGQLAKLERVWARVVAEEESGKHEAQPEDLLGRKDPWPPKLAALAKNTFRPDKGEANGSSIAFLAEYDGKRVLLAADAHAGRIGDSLDRLSSDNAPLKLSAYKLSHHGSAKSNSSEVLRRVSCKQYLVSTDGSYFGHPDAEAMARVLYHGGKAPTLVFNYSSPFTSRWQHSALKGSPPFSSRFPKAGAEGIEVVIS
jgi:beta-lactamase superfamily II metal-dependent hydrolase